MAKSKLEELQDLLDGTADEETKARISAELRDPNSSLRGFLEGARRRAERDPCDIDWLQLFEDDDEPDGPAEAEG